MDVKEIAAAAKAEGLSYGAYVTKHSPPVTVDIPKAPEQEPDPPAPEKEQGPKKICRHCGKEFQLSPHQHRKQFCSDVCKRAAKKAKTRKEPAIRDSGDRTIFPTGAVRDMQGGKGRMDLLPWEAIVEVARHCEEGARKYGERNVEKGIPLHSLLDSGLRHLAKYMMGFKDEPHLRAAAWNILWAIWMEEKHPEMQDIPSRKEDEHESGL